MCEAIENQFAMTNEFHKSFCFFEIEGKINEKHTVATRSIHKSYLAFEKYQCGLQNYKCNTIRNDFFLTLLIRLIQPDCLLYVDIACGYDRKFDVSAVCKNSNFHMT